MQNLDPDDERGVNMATVKTVLLIGDISYHSTNSSMM